MRIVLFTGKGGVGKTTTAAATALRLADRGRRTLLLSTDTAHSLGDALGVPLSGEPTEVQPGLTVVQLDPQLRLEAAWRDVQSFLIDMLARSGVDEITADELTVLPGIEEVLALLAVRQFALTGSWDAVVVDCAPTAETLRLLALPEALGWYLTKVFPAQRRMARSLRPIAGMLGRPDTVPPDSLFDALLRLNDELASVRELLGDPGVTSVRLVLTPESVVVAEARRTFTALALYGYGVDLVVANRVFPGGDDAWRQGWARAQQAQLATIRESFAGLPVRELPYRSSEPIGAEALRDVADAIYGELPGTDPVAVRSGPPLMQVGAEEGGYVLRMSLPLAARGSVDAVRVGDDLVISVDGHRRVLSLPQVLRRCEVTGGRFDGGQLRVTFRPEPRPRPAPGGST
jgi:arsenite/tail-anchored protein-transporting ATPase